MTATAAKLNPIQEAATELNAAESALNDLDRELARVTQRRGVAQERATAARRTYDRLVRNARSADLTR